MERDCAIGQYVSPLGVTFGLGVLNARQSARLLGGAMVSPIQEASGLWLNDDGGRREGG